MIELSAEQEREIRAAGWPPRVRTPQSREEFVLLPVEMYERCRAVLEAEDEIPAVREMYPLAARVLDADADAARGSA